MICKNSLLFLGCKEVVVVVVVGFAKCSVLEVHVVNVGVLI